MKQIYTSICLCCSLHDRATISCTVSLDYKEFFQIQIRSWEKYGEKSGLHSYLEWSFWRRAERCLGCWFITWSGQLSDPTAGWEAPSAKSGLIASSKFLKWSLPPGCRRANSISTWKSSHDFAMAQQADWNKKILISVSRATLEIKEAAEGKSKRNGNPSSLWQMQANVVENKFWN